MILGGTEDIIVIKSINEVAEKYIVAYRDGNQPTPRSIPDPMKLPIEMTPSRSIGNELSS